MTGGAAASSPSPPQAPLAGDAVPRLRPGFRLKRDDVRDRWILQAPERIFVLDAVAVAILRQCDGKTTLEAIAGSLAERYDAPRDVIFDDSARLIVDFIRKGAMTA